MKLFFYKLDKNKLAILSLFLGSFLFCLNEAIVKNLTTGYTSYEIMFYRGFCLIILLLIFTLIQKENYKLKTTKLNLHIVRSFFSTMSFLLSTKSLTGLQLFSFQSIYFIVPIITAIFGITFFKDKISRWHMMAFLFCSVGILVAFNPGSDIVSVYGLYALGAVISTSLAILIFKKMASTESTHAIILYYSLCSLIVSGFLVDRDNMHFVINDIYIFILIALLHLIASFLFTWGMRLQNLVNISIAHYASLPFSILLGWYFWHDLPSVAILSASFIIVISNIILLKKENEST